MLHEKGPSHLWKGERDHEKPCTGAPDRGRHDPAAAGGSGPRVLPHHHLPGEGAVQPVPVAGVPTGAGVPHHGGGPVLPGGEQGTGGPGK